MAKKTMCDGAHDVVSGGQDAQYIYSRCRKCDFTAKVRRTPPTPKCRKCETRDATCTVERKRSNAGVVWIISSRKSEYCTACAENEAAIRSRRTAEVKAKRDARNAKKGTGKRKGPYNKGQR